MSNHQRRVEEILRLTENRRSTYGATSVNTAAMKHEGTWRNIVSKIIPLYRSESPPAKTELNYGDFVIIKDTIMLDDFVEIVRRLPENASTTVTLGDYEVQIRVEDLESGYTYYSGSGFFGVQWSLNKYLLRGSSPSSPSGPLVSPTLPAFPDYRAAVDSSFGIDVLKHSNLQGVVMCLPNYGARIEEVSLGSEMVTLKVEARAEKVTNIVGKLYCKKGKATKHEDIEFENNAGEAKVGFMPDAFYLALISRTNGDLLDWRQFYSGWELPGGVRIDIPEYELFELIRHGETEKVEFKEDIGKPEEFAETGVAFANGAGGVILLGVDNHANIVGLPERNYEDMITNILRSHCDPQVRYRIEKRQLDEKNLILVHVEEGKDKPFTVREKGVYVRANGTDRIATRYELDEFYRKQSSYY